MGKLNVSAADTVAYAMSVEPILDAVAADRTVRSARRFVTPRMVIRVTRRFPSAQRNRRQEFVVTIGEPNYRERRFVARCRRNGEPLPVGIQFDKYPTKKRGKS